MPTRDVVVIGASAGGLEAVCEVLSQLPPDYPGVVAIVMHIPSHGGSSLPHIFDRCGPLPAKAATDGDTLTPGQVYVCTPDHHLLLGDGVILLRRGAKENGHRPAVDALFRSAARYFGLRVIGVVLSRTLSDGTAGLEAIRRQGGVAMAQEPSDAAFPDMPMHAIDEAGADYVLPADEMGAVLTRLAQEEITSEPSAPAKTLRQEVALMETNDRVVETDRAGPPRGRAPTATASFGNSTTATSCGSAVASVMRGRRPRCSPSRATPWTPRCGSHCARSKTAPRWLAAWPNGPQQLVGT